MDVTGSGLMVDRDRAVISARSVLANLDVFVGQGLPHDQRAAIEQCVTVLRRPPGQVTDHDAADRAGQLRELLAGISGPTAAILVGRFDDALGRPR